MTFLSVPAANPSLTRYWTGIKQTTWKSFAKYAYQDSPRVTPRGKPSNGYNATGGFPWNHWGNGQPDDSSNGRCVASDKALKFYRYDPTDMTTRVLDTDISNNVFGWDDASCSESLPIICVWSCGCPQHCTHGGCLLCMAAANACAAQHSIA